MQKKQLSFLLIAFLLLGASLSFASDVSGKQKVNINKAGLDELITLPRIGPAMAKRIADYREKNGNFKKIEDLMQVKGIGEKTFLQLKDLITVGEDRSEKAPASAER